MISILDLALRTDTPIHVRPDPGGWLAHRCAGADRTSATPQETA